MTAAALAATGSVPARAVAGVADAGITRLPFPQDYRCPYGVGGIAGERIAVEHARRLFDDPGSGMTPPAAMLVEPVQGEGGVLPAPDGWLRALRTLAAEHGVPLIADEVQTGLGRTGELWGVDHAEVVPDMMVLAKAIGGGLPLAVLVYRGEYDVWTEGAHAGTFRGHQLAMAAGTATMRFIVEHSLVEHARKLGDRLREDLAAAAAELPAIGDVRGRGLMIGVDLVDPDCAPDALGARPAAPGLARRVRAEALERGLIVELGGRHGAVLRLLPPLIMTELEAEQVRELVLASIAAAGAAWRP
jgi:diaminobutyrate-2-oxoglutarate transaminase